MLFREYQTSDCKEITELFYSTVHTVNAKDYTKEQWAELLQVKDNGLKAIEAAKNIEEATVAGETAVASMAEVKTYAILLGELKTAALAELKKEFDAIDQAYYFETLDELKEAYTNGTKALEAVTVIEDVETKLAEALAAIKAVKQDVAFVDNGEALKQAIEAKYLKIVLNANVENTYITVDYRVILDLNGHTMQLADRNNAVVTVKAGGEFTL